MKLTIDIKDEKVPFFLELLQNFKGFVTIENDDNIVAYTTGGQPLTKEQFVEEVMSAYQSAKNGRTLTTEQLLENMKTW